jgi:predicted nuclease of predicted toxin-antitoxin system
MKVLFDVHIALKVSKFFAAKGIEAVHVNNVLDGFYTKDSSIAQYADQNDYTLITKDADFKDSHFVSQTPRKLLKINLGNIPTNQLITIFEASFDTLVELFDKNPICYVEINSKELAVIV